MLGSHYLVDNHPELFAGATEAISEVGGYSITFGGTRAYLLQTGEKALVWIKLIARGTAAHGSRLIHDNAVTKLAEAVAKVGRSASGRSGSPTPPRELLGELARILGVDPQKVGPDELAHRHGNGRRLHPGHAAHHDQPDRAERRLQAQRDPRHAPRRSSTSAPCPGEEDAVLAEHRASSSAPTSRS